jgi:WD repeat and SOF domain-containing protein 1
MDNRYILCGSDEMNITFWKARSAEKLGVLKPCEKATLNYSEALKQTFTSHPQIRYIACHQQIPRQAYHAQKEFHILKMKEKREEANRRAHSKPGTVHFV